MRRTIKGKLTISVVCIVAVSILLTTIGIVFVAGERVIIRTKLEKPSKIKGLALI